MKSVIFYLAAFFCYTAANGQTTVYHPFPDSNAVWNVQSFQACQDPFSFWEHSYSIMMTSDTVISSTTYHKLQVPIEVVQSNGLCDSTGSWTAPGFYSGAIRQEVAQRKVYFVPPTDTTEQLLYDFNLQVGDTVGGYLGSIAYPPDTVQSIDSVQIGSTFRKRWQINSCYGIYLIEGVGSTYGLVERSPGCITDVGSYVISCYSENGSVLYPSSTSGCELITGIDTRNMNGSATSIYPNPMHTESTIQLGENFGDGELRLYNAVGGLVAQKSISGQRSLTLDRQNLDVGIYFVQLTDHHGQVTTLKLIVE